MTTKVKNGWSTILTTVGLLGAVGVLVYKNMLDERATREAAEQARFEARLNEEKAQQALGEELGARCRSAITEASSQVLDITYKYRLGMGDSVYPSFKKTTTGYRVYTVVDLGSSKVPTACYFDEQRRILNLSIVGYE